MNPSCSTSVPAARLDGDGLDSLIAALRREGYTVIGPALRDQAIVYDEITGIADLPVGLTDEQDAGTYRVRDAGAPTLFGYAVGPRSIKNFLYPPRSLLVRARGDRTDFVMEPPAESAPKYAFFGVRACELAAVAVQDKVFLGGPYVDSDYEVRRSEAFFVAVHCGAPSGTCFCVSMNTGPKAESGFDIALTEVHEGGAHYFVAESGTERGARLLKSVSSQEATNEEVRAAQRVVEDSARRMGRRMDTANIRELLYAHAESPRWEAIAKRCLACANCTMVCPTCFCSTVEDTTSLSGDTAERWRTWDSCFTMDFSYLHGGSVRKSGASRYRQWMTHKLASWHDQFGTSGCVGCGRCITWCPVGIDITEEVAAFRAVEVTGKNGGG
jgi:formate hydrogenlyase subunit 6/NADH:ubiquinone oxidoreductase subunit I